jgi:hypothetical protein
MIYFDLELQGKSVAFICQRQDERVKSAGFQTSFG